MPLYHFECSVCELSDAEAGGLASEEQRYCPLCAEDNGRLVELRRWPATETGPRCSFVVAEGD